MGTVSVSYVQIGDLSKLIHFKNDVEQKDSSLN